MSSDIFMPHVIITRCPAQSHLLAEGLTKRGIKISFCPTLNIQLATPIPLEDDPSFDYIIFTSQNAVHAFANSAALPACSQVVAVGTSTASLIEKCFGVIPLVPHQHFNALALAQALPLQPGQRILLPQGNLAGPALQDALQARGAHVTPITVYHTTPVTHWQLPAINSHELPIITLFSPSGVDVAANSIRHHPNMIVACIGTTTAQHARAQGLPVHCIAATQTQAGLLQALLTYVSDRAQ